MNSPGEQITGLGLVLSGDRTDPEMARLLEKERERTRGRPPELKEDLKAQGFYPGEQPAEASAQDLFEAELEMDRAIGSLMPVEINFL